MNNFPIAQQPSNSFQEVESKRQISMRTGYTNLKWLYYWSLHKENQLLFFFYFLWGSNLDNMIPSHSFSYLGAKIWERYVFFWLEWDFVLRNLTNHLLANFIRSQKQKCSTTRTPLPSTVKMKWYSYNYKKILNFQILQKYNLHWV